MRAMVLRTARTSHELEDRPDPKPNSGEIRVTVSACWVCRTDLHVVDAKLPGIRYPMIPGHKFVGRIDRLGPAVSTHWIGNRVDIPPLGYTFGVCRYCREDLENLCDRPVFTSYMRDDGFATQVISDRPERHRSDPGELAGR